MIKSGDGSQTATWKIPVPEAGQYELYYHVFKDDELRWNDRLQGEYHFRVAYDSEMEDAYINLRKPMRVGNNSVLTILSADTVRVVLNG